ncbi:FG-GAP-like repeat-containing protein [Hymenobacter edaphi]|uniref:Secretion system C-terminal sorting domain-containing protein n=1 Tax=Hymenobacter edaphi TaxID=2211146 RepID=A0A328BGB6_9BACT|nr:FG-GAP-like repeat-containing protein [Hymenobacter edaphi]RAK65927.1 hypothetical protein DLM85_14550 [Hymenobacter edaphi]
MEYFSSPGAGRLGQLKRTAWLLTGLGLLALPALAQPTVSSVAPARNQRSAPRSSNVSFTLSQALNAGSANALKVFGSRRGGLLSGTATISGNTVTFDPGTDFQPGETVYATLTTAAQNTSNQPLAQGQVMSFVAAASGSGTFAAAPSLTVPTAGQGAAVGDINGDGLMDIVMGTSSNALVTFLNQGGGVFPATPSTSVITNAGPSQIVLGDVDNDGDLDVVIPSFNASGVSVHRNVGGTLGAATLLGAGVNPRMSALVDVNGDAYLDILTANVSSNTVTLNLNNAGTFGASTVVANVGAGPFALGAADLNGDGRMDFIAANANSNNLSVRLGNGDGSFSGTGLVNLGFTPFGMALGDLNGDNIADLVTANRFGAEVGVALGVGNGTFGTPFTVASGGAEAIDVALADLDADGDLDIVVCNYLGNNLAVCRNNGAASFGAPTVYAASTNPFVVTTGDLDGNGSIDIVCSNISSTTVNVLRNGALTDLTVSTTANIPAGSYNNVTVTGTGVGTLTGAVSVAGAFTVQSGGVLATNCQPLTGAGSFTLQSGAELRICDAAGISSTGSTGAVQVAGTRSFSNDATYLYNGTAPQVTGAGLPPRVRDLAVSNGTGVTLSTATSVAQVLRLTTGVLSTGGQNLTLLSDSTGTALAVNGTGSASGNVTVQRFISRVLNAGAGYRHYSAPVSGSSVADLATAGFTPVVNASYNSATNPGGVTPFPTVFAYDESRVLTSPATTYSTFDKGWVSPVALTTALDVARGYTVNIPGNQKVDFVGTLNNGTVSLPLARNGGASGGLFLVGNPYPAPLNWSQVTIPTGLDNAMYVFQSTSRYGGGYRSYVNGVGDPLVSSGQGFFVRLTPGSNAATLNFSNAARVTSYATQPSFNRGGETRPLVQLSLQGDPGTPADEVHVYQEAGATAVVDAAYDAVKLPNAHGLNLAAVAAGTELAINGLPLLTTSTVVPLTVSVPQTGLYTLRAAALLNLTTSTVYLHDAATGQDVNLSLQPAYSFSANARSLPGRFSLRFEPARPTAAHGSQSALALDVYPNPATGSFTLQLPAVAGATQAEATLFNALGQRVRTQTVALPATGARTTIDARKLAAGVYLLQVQVGEHTASRRVTLY